MATTSDGKATKGFMAVCANGGVAQSITDTEVELDFATITTGKGIQLDLDGLTTGTGLEIRIDSDIATTGKALEIKGGSAMGTSVMQVHSQGITMGSTFAIKGAGVGANGLLLGNLKTAAYGALSGTTQTVEIDMNGTSYYLEIFPTKA